LWNANHIVGKTAAAIVVAREGRMSTEDEVKTHDEEHKKSHHDEAVKRRYKEFIDLMPLTIAIAGLQANPGPRSYGVDQMEARAQVLQSAFKIARQTVREAIKKSH
jgi:hypothetical protein